MMILPAMFCLGAFALLAQVAFTREALVAFYGNELCIGVVLSGWLIGIAAGSVLSRFVCRRENSPESLSLALIVTSFVLAAALPFQMWAMRLALGLLGVPYGEYAPLSGVFGGSLLVFLPTSLGIGIFFPLACRIAGRGEGAPVGIMYAAESLGSAAGGIVVTFLVLPFLSPAGMVAVGMALALFAGAFASHSKWPRSAMGMLAVVTLAATTLPGVMDHFDRQAVSARWRSFGVAGHNRGNLCAWTDSVYQNLALIKTDDQYALYANGKQSFVFPDPAGDELRIHFIMAQNPSARRILVLGGNPAGDITELLKYACEEIVFVEIDPAVGKLIAPYTGSACSREDPRVRYVNLDAARYVARCGEKFDAILVNAPQPASAASGRFYTREFYRSVSRLLAPGGFMYAALDVTEGLKLESAKMGASVWNALREVYPVVLVTGGSRVQFFAGSRDSGLTFDRETLRGRSAGSGIRTSYFRPEYFLGADEISADKTSYTTSRFAAAGVAPNSISRPVACYYSLLTWSRVSGSGVEGMLSVAGRLNPRLISIIVVLAGPILFAAGFVIRRKRRSGRTADAWSQAMIGLVVLTTGFVGMAMEIVLVYMFQSSQGYVYSRIGLLVALFMTGLAMGALGGRLLASGSGRRAFLALGVAETALAVLFVATAWLAVVLLKGGGLSGWIIYGLVAATGALAGIEFPVAVRLSSGQNAGSGQAVAWFNAADHLGAAAGGLLAGVLLVPVFGITASCGMLIALKVLSLMGLWGTRQSM